MELLGLIILFLVVGLATVVVSVYAVQRLRRWQEIIRIRQTYIPEIEAKLQGLASVWDKADEQAKWALEQLPEGEDTLNFVRAMYGGLVKNLHDSEVYYQRLLEGVKSDPLSFEEPASGIDPPGFFLPYDTFKSRLRQGVEDIMRAQSQTPPVST